MKTIMANVSNSFFVRNILLSDTLKTLIAGPDIRLVLLAPKDKIEYYQAKFSRDGIVFDILPDVKSSIVEIFFEYLETASIHSRTVIMQHRWKLMRMGSGFLRPQKYLQFFFSLILWNLGRFKFWRSIIRKAYYFLENKSFDEILDKYKPDLIFCPSMIYLEDHVLAKAAKKRGIKFVGMTLSWDNFYSKTFIRIPPDKLIVHTNYMREQAEKSADYPRKYTAITGIPQYDKYFKGEGILSRGEFFKKIGADPKKKLILYGFSGKAGIGIELDVIKVLHSLMQNNDIPDANVLLRPYPKYDFPHEKLENIKKELGFLGEAPTIHIGRGKNDWEFDEEALSLLANSLAHADVVITMYSTFFIEAAIFNKPLIGIAFDGEKTLDYWNSARRFFDWDHLSDVRKNDGIWLVRDKKEFADAICRYFKNPHYKEEGRKKIVLEQCQFTDGNSGKRVGEELLKII